MMGMSFERILGGVCAPAGFMASGVACGIKEDGAQDLAVVFSETVSSVAGVFTTNSAKAAPVLVSSELAAKGEAQAIVISSGNANAMTGKQGRADALAMVRELESELGLAGGHALVASTGPIGEPMPMAKVKQGIRTAASELSSGGNTDAAKAIMTTDSYPKELALEMEIGGRQVRIGAMTKGSGMIHPNMATMICVITTDAKLDPEMMKFWLAQAVEWSFNRISVDGDQSTNDTVLMFANGLAFDEGYQMTQAESALFFESLCWLTGHLAMALVNDGEGGDSKLVRIVVNGAGNDSSAVRVARAIANSNLVKSAVYGGLPNWGRIAAAAGSAGVEFDPDKMEIYLGEHMVASNGAPVPFDEDEVKIIMGREEVEITVHLGFSEGSAYYMTRDLTPEYVVFNAGEKS